MPAWLPAAMTAVGALGSLFGGGEGESSTTQTQTRAMTPEQRRFLEMLQSEYGRQAFDISGIKRATRERLGAETSGLRQAALQRLTRSGVTGLQRESALKDITTTGLRELGSTLADLEFGAQEAEEQRRLALLGQQGGFLSGFGTTTTTGQQQMTPPTGGGFAQLFGAGLQGLLQSGGGASGGANTGAKPFFQSPYRR